MFLLAFLLSAVLVCAQSRDAVISRTAAQTCSVRLVPLGGETPQHDLFFVRIRTSKRGADTSAAPVREINGAGLWVEVAGRTPDSTGIVLMLVDAAQRGAKKFPRTRHAVLTDDGADGYRLRYVDGALWTSTRDVVQGARMVHKGETKLPIADLEPIDLKSEPFRRLLSAGAYTMAKIDRVEPMWLLSEETSGARAVLNYGYDEDGQSVVQVVRLWYFPLKRLVYCRGAIVSVTPERNAPPEIGVFDESQDSSRFARVTVYGWQLPDADSMVDGRYKMRTMTVMSSCVIPPKQWLPFPLLASVIRPTRLGFAPGYEGCASARHGDASWPFGSPLEASTSCEILATSKDASDNAWHFIGVRLPNDPAVRRLFGDYSSSETEQLITGGWVAASALDTLGLPGVEVNR
jgi:hypothetical protein